MLHICAFRMGRGDMIDVYKIIRQIYDSSVAPNLQLGNTGVTRGNKYKLLNHIRLEVTLENFVSLHGLLTFGTVYQIMLLMYC